ncbi:MAG: HEAT repeat domain-containing protein, partial [Planctomycetes bacterium]|nr:HEAT repeat domain-containing protein [Planctomycetota bacterium]
VKALKHSDPFVRSRAAVVLGQIGPAAKAAVPALIEALKDPNPYTRWSVVEALGKIGPKARDAMPALRAALRDKNDGVRSSAAESIRRIKGRPAQLEAPQLPGLAVEPSNSAG